MRLGLIILSCTSILSSGDVGLIRNLLHARVYTRPGSAAIPPISGARCIPFAPIVIAPNVAQHEAVAAQYRLMWPAKTFQHCRSIESEGHSNEDAYPVCRRGAYRGGRRRSRR